MIEDAVTRDKPVAEYFEAEEIWPFGHGLLCTGNLYTPEGMGALAILAVDREAKEMDANPAEAFDRLIDANGQRLLLTFKTVENVRNLIDQLFALEAGMKSKKEKQS